MKYLCTLEIAKTYSRDVSIYEPIGYDKEGNEIALIDVLKGKEANFIENMHTKNNINLLKKYFNVLNEREKKILTKRYGLDGNPEMTQKNIAKELGISRSYVSRIEKRAIVKILREFIRNQK